MEISVGRKGKLTVKTENRLEYLSSTIFLLEVLYPDKKKSTLSDVQRDFLSHCILLDLEGIRIGSSEAIKELGKRMNLSKTRVYDLRRLLKKKGWLKQDDLGYSYPSILTKNSLEVEIKLDEDGQ